MPAPAQIAVLAAPLRMQIIGAAGVRAITKPKTTVKKPIVKAVK